MRATNEVVKHLGYGQTDQIEVMVVLPPSCPILYTLTTVNFGFFTFKMGVILLFNVMLS